MARGPWRGPLRVVAVAAGVLTSLLTAGLAHADLPGGIPDPVGLPGSGQPITIILEPPSVAVVSIPVAPDGCAIDMSYDNTQASPPGSIFRGQTACGSGVYSPIISGHAQLLDVFGQVVA